MQVNFYCWHSLALQTKKNITICYGIYGHGKGLLDDMSGFVVKSPLCKAVLTKDCTYRSVEDIYDYLSFLFRNDESKRYYNFS